MAYKYVAGHVDVTSDGHLLAFGDTVEKPDQRLIDQGFVIPLEDAPPSADPVTADTKETVADATGN